MRTILTLFTVFLFSKAIAQAPNWTVNPNAFQYDMTVTAVLDVNCTELANPSNQLAAFHQGTLRGTSQTLNFVGGRYIATMTVYSNQLNAESIQFAFYDAAQDSLYQSIDSVLFQDNAIYGTPTAPFVVRTNHAPTAISLSKDSILENQAAAQLVGVLSTSDLDLTQSHTYTFANGSGSADNSRFTISGNQLLANFTADFETKNSYSVRIQTTDSEGCTYQQAFPISVSNLNDPPTALLVSASTIDENLTATTLVGTLSALDSDANETFTYSLVTGAGGSDNSSFSIFGNELRTTASFNYEVQSLYHIRIQVADAASNTFVDTFKIAVNDINDLPTDIQLSSDSVDENLAINALVANLSVSDEDFGQNHAFSFNNVAGNDNALFNIVGDKLRTKANFDYESQHQYFIYIQVDDLNGGTFSKQFTIEIKDANDAPTDITLSTQSVNENRPISSFVANLFTSDQDANDSFTYNLVSGVGDADNANFFIRNDSLFTQQVLSLNAQASHSIRIQSNDGNGGLYSKAVSLTVKDINDVPTDILLSNQIIPENINIGQEIGLLSTLDPDAGDVHTYSLVSGVGDSNNLAFTISNNKLLANQTFNYNQQQNYSVRLQTNDGFGGVFQKVFSLTVVNANDAPTDILLSNDSLFESMPANTLVGLLTAVDSDSADTHTFSFVSGTNNNADFAIVGNELRSVSTFNYEQKSNYFIHLQASDGNGGLFQKQLNIIIKDTTDGPTDIALSNQMIQENLQTRSFIGLLSSTDEDANDTFTYSFVNGANSADNAAFQLFQDSLFTLDTFDFENRSQYAIRIRSTDQSNLFTEKGFAISITNGNDAPTDVNLTSSSIAENSAIGTTVGVLTSLDPDTGNTFSYTFANGAGDADNASFSLVGNALKSNTLFDVNIKSTYTIRLRTTDNQGLFFEKPFIITVVNSNDAPTDISLLPNSINENLPPNTLVGKFSTVDPDVLDQHIYTFANLGANDNASFIIVGDELRTAATFDYESKSIYFVQVQSSDGNGGTYSRQLFVHINDTNDLPTDVFLSGNSVLEKQSTNQFVGKLSSQDQDANDRYTYTLVNGNGADDNVSFSISNDSLFSQASFDVLVKNQLSVRIQTEDSTNQTFSKAFTIYVQDVNDAPFNLFLSNNSIPENATLNTSIGSLSASDIDPNQSFTYGFATGLGDDDNAAFTIVANELRTNTLLSYNQKRTYSIRLKVLDQGGLEFQKSFTVHVLNSNDQPTEITLQPAAFNENLPIGTVVSTLSTTDADSNDVFTYSFVNTGTNDNAAFLINGNQLRTAQNFDFESKALYIIEIQTRDQAGATFSKQLSITILDTNDAPSALTISADTLLEKAVKGSFVANLNTQDVDASDNHTYSLVAGQGSTDNALFRINGNLLEVDSVLAFNNGKKRFVRIRSSDQDGLSVEAAFVINIKNVNDSPEDILLSDTMVNENAAAGSRLALITTVDQDLGDAFTYELVAGTGDDDNATFIINGNELQSMFNFDFESKNTFQIRLRSTDKAGATFEKSFSLHLENGNEAPSIENQQFVIVENAAAATLIGQLQANDVDAFDSLQFRLIGTSVHFRVEAKTGYLYSLNSFDYEGQSQYEIQVEVSDLAGLKDTAEVIVIVQDQVESSLPVASYFSPNGDGKNDQWEIQNVALYANYEISIFSSNGELVYNKKSNYSNNWDGTSAGEQLPEGVYYYLLQDPLNSTNSFKGTITLKR